MSDTESAPDDPGSDPARTPTIELVDEPRSLGRIDDALNEFFALFQSTYTDYEDCEPREAFAKYMAEEYGVVIPDNLTGFDAVEQDLGHHGIVTGGRGGGEIASSNFAIDYNCGLVDGGLDQIDGWQLTALADRPPSLRFVDTEDVGDDLEDQAPADANQFVQALLEQYDIVDANGSGNDAIQGLQNLLAKPDFLAWFLQALVLDERSVVETVSVLGGGTGTALTILCDEFARMGLVGQGDVAVGFNIGVQQGRVANDVALNQFDNGTARYTFHDAYATTYRVGQSLVRDDADWALFTENVPLTYNFWALQNNPDYLQMRDFYQPIRDQADPRDMAFAVDNEPRFVGIGHTQRDRIKCLGDFAFRQLLRRHARAEFSLGIDDEDYDPADFRTDFHGFAWTSGFDAIHDMAELEDRNIPRIDGVNGHREALRALGYTAATTLNSTVSHDEIQRTNAVVHAADVSVTADDLGLVEDAVTDALGLGYTSTGERDKPTRAILMDGLGTDHYPGSYPLSVTVYAGHDLPVLAHETMATPEYKAAVTGGDY